MADRMHSSLHLVVPLCPFDMKVGETYIDKADGFTFTVAERELLLARIRIVTTAGRRTSFGGLYRGIYLATPSEAKAV